MYEGRASAALQAFEQALEHLGDDSPPRSWNALLFSMGRCLVDGPLPLERATAFASERLEVARAEGARSLEADMLHLLGMASARRGRFDEARRALEVSTAVSEELGLAYMAQWSKQTMGKLELGAGDLEAAERALRSSFDVLSGMGLNSTLGETAVPLADALYQQGRYQEATEILDSVKDEWVSGDAAIEAPRLAIRAKLMAAQGWERHAQRAAERALRVARRTEWACLKSDTLIAYAEVLRVLGREEDAVQSMHEARGVAEAKGYAVAVRWVDAELERLGAPDAERVS
jgi:tetratricopeptide (TPR) repeat protein